MSLHQESHPALALELLPLRIADGEPGPGRHKPRQDKLDDAFTGQTCPLGCTTGTKQTVA